MRARGAADLNPAKKKKEIKKEGRESIILVDLFQLFHVKGSLGYSSGAEPYRMLENEMESICGWKAGWPPALSVVVFTTV